MKNTQALIFIAFLFLSSCQRKESIEPFAQATTVAQSQGLDPELTVVSGAFTFDEFDIDNPVGSVPVPILGVFVENLAALFADIFVLLNNDWEVEQEALFIDIPELDPDYFKELLVNNLEFSITGGNTEKAALDFIEKITIYVANEEMWDREEKVMLAQYKYDKAALKRCKKKCLSLRLLLDENSANEDRPINLMKYLANAKRLYIIPQVEINSIPKSEFKISGNIDFRLAFKLPF